MKVSLSGKVAIVTGAAGGIGPASVRRLSSDGAAVVLAELQGEAVMRAADSLDAAGYRAPTHVIELAVADEIGTLVDQTASEFGRLDVVVNAGGIQPYGTVADTSPTEWDAFSRSTSK